MGRESNKTILIIRVRRRTQPCGADESEGKVPRGQPCRADTGGV